MEHRDSMGGWAAEYEAGAPSGLDGLGRRPLMVGVRAEVLVAVWWSDVDAPHRPPNINYYSTVCFFPRAKVSTRRWQAVDIPYTRTDSPCCSLFGITNIIDRTDMQELALFCFNFAPYQSLPISEISVAL